MPRVEVIAEIGSCHGGDLMQAQRLVEAAAAAGADTVKGQFWSSWFRLADRRKAGADYRRIYAQYQTPAFWMSFLAAACERVGVRWLCTVYLPEDVMLVSEYSDRLKIASFEAMDRNLVEAAAAVRPVIVSVGMQTEDERVATGSRLRPTDACLHCVSAYPADIAAMNLRALWTHAAINGVGCCNTTGWECIPGLSDHSRQIDMGAMAVAAGAEIIEAHIRLDDTDPQNPDFETAFSPAEFAEYVALIRRAETIMGDGVKRLQPAERAMAAYRVRG